MKAAKYHVLELSSKGCYEETIGQEVDAHNLNGQMLLPVVDLITEACLSGGPVIASPTPV